MRENLIKFRGDHTQQEMGERYGVCQQTWSAWERGDITPSAKNMRKISKDSGMTVEELFLQP